MPGVRQLRRAPHPGGPGVERHAEGGGRRATGGSCPGEDHRTAEEKAEARPTSGGPKLIAGFGANCKNALRTENAVSGFK